MLNVQEIIIGTGGDYPTITAFSSAFDNTLISNPETTVIVKLKAEVFDEWGLSITVPTNCRFFHLTAENDYHKGVLTNSGPIIRAVTPTASTAALTLLVSDRSWTPYVTISKIAIDGNSNYTGSAQVSAISLNGSLQTSIGLNTIIDKCLFTMGTMVSARGFVLASAAGRPCMLSNSLIYGVNSAGVSATRNSYGIGGDEQIFSFFNTIDDLSYPNATASSFSYGIDINSTPVAQLAKIQGNIVTGIVSNAGTTACYDPNVTASTGFLYNVSDDLTGNTSSTAGTEFEDAAGRDYSLASGASSIGLVSDVGANFDTPNLLGIIDLQRDITNRKRALGNWDAGCFNNRSGYQSEPSTGGSQSVLTKIGAQDLFR